MKRLFGRKPAPASSGSTTDAPRYLGVPFRVYPLDREHLVLINALNGESHRVQRPLAEVLSVCTTQRTIVGHYALLESNGVQVFDRAETKAMFDELVRRRLMLSESDIADRLLTVYRSAAHQQRARIEHIAVHRRDGDQTPNGAHRNRLLLSTAGSRLLAKESVVDNIGNSEIVSRLIESSPGALMDRFGSDGFTEIDLTTELLPALLRPGARIARVEVNRPSDRPGYAFSVRPDPDAEITGIDNSVIPVPSFPMDGFPEKLTSATACALWGGDAIVRIPSGLWVPTAASTRLVRPAEGVDGVGELIGRLLGYLPPASLDAPRELMLRQWGLLLAGIANQPTERFRLTVFGTSPVIPPGEYLAAGVPDGEGFVTLFREDLSKYGGLLTDWPRIWNASRRARETGTRI